MRRTDWPTTQPRVGALRKRYYIKIVPLLDPMDESDWLDCGEYEFSTNLTFAEKSVSLAKHCPDGHMIVDIMAVA